ncbi:hypothetical protein QF019_002449 [Pseudomonas frederiksbergensis]|uniref:hypothetical protein n=1 Tax=Pseudomonas frederiksbergensis TaxID=104087 RepID=UPI003D1CDF27
MTDHTELKRLAEAFPEYDYDSNTEPFFNGPSGESLGGGSTGFYCVYGPEFEIDGESYDGVTLVESCPADQAKFICVAKAGILALIAENELQDRLIVENKTISDSFRAERDHLKAENEALRRQAETAQRGTGQLVAENEALRLRCDRLDADKLAMAETHVLYTWLRMKCYQPSNDVASVQINIGHDWVAVHDLDRDLRTMIDREEP